MKNATLFSFERLYRAYEDCRKTKRTTSEALLFELDAEEEISRLQQELTERSFRPSTSLCFVTRSPKLREIFAADFRDRITHHLLVRELEKIWEPLFIYDSYASRPEKGIHVAATRLQGFTGQVTQNSSRRAFYAQLDIKNFFMRINKQILFALIRARCRNEEMLWLAETLIFHDPTNDYRLRSPKSLLAQLPRQKSLFGAEKEYGLPIGNLTSQFFANVYLNGLDQFVKHRLKCRWYMRYVDDFLLLDPDQHRLKEWIRAIEEYLLHTLELTLNPARTKVRPVSNGIDFLGYVVRPTYILCRNRVVNNLKTQLRAYENTLIETRSDCTLIRYDHSTLEALFACLNSYFGHFRHARTFSLRQGIFERFPFLSYYFRDKKNKLRRCYLTPKGFWNLHAQYNYFQNRYYRSLIFFQVGCFYEFYGAQALKAWKYLKLSTIRPKYGFRRRCGIGAKALDRFVTLALEQQIQVTLIQQSGVMLPHVAERRVTVRYLP